MRTLGVLALVATVLAFTGFVASGRQSDDVPFTMALVGDAVITRQLSVHQEPEFLRMIALVRGADVAFANVEVLFHDYEPYPMHESGGTYMRAEPELAEALAWAGFDVVSLANNHAGDYGVEGMRLTRKYVREAGLVGAGTGESLAEAREAKFVETTRGRVALIALASTFPRHSVAGKPRGAVRGRPGLSPLHYTRRRVVTEAQLEALRQALGTAGVDVPTEGDQIDIFGETFVVGESLGVRTEPDSQDLVETAGVVRSAARLADYVIVSLHAHERSATDEPVEFVVTFAHAMIDAGADVFVGHGPHILGGIEIYKGKPIFYSMGNFIFQNETVLRLPEENYSKYGLDERHHVADFNAVRSSNETRGFPANPEVWESVIAALSWRGKQLVGIELYPIMLGFGKPPSERGRPLLADRELGRQIIDRLVQRSQPLGTTVEWRNGVGVIGVAESK